MKHLLLSLLFVTAISADWLSIYNPERGAYMDQTHEKPQTKQCPFCAQLEEHKDAENFILKRYEHISIFLNRFPYQYGHMLIIPKRHIANLEDLTDKEYTELFHLIRKAVCCLKETYNIDGANVGINLGSAAGASKPDHLHVHILPRWHHDTGWLHTIGQTSVMAHDMQKVYTKLKTWFDN